MFLVIYVVAYLYFVFKVFLLISIYALIINSSLCFILFYWRWQLSGREFPAGGLILRQQLDGVKVSRYNSGSVPPKFEHKLHRHKQRFRKIATTVISDKDENLLWSRLQRHRSCHSNEMRLLPILLAAVFLGTGTVLPKSFTGAFSSNSRLDVREV